MEQEKRKAYREKLEAQLREWNAKIEELSAKADKAKAQGKVEFLEQMEKLKGRRTELESKLREVKGASGEAWKSLWAGAEKAAADLKQALEDARAKFK